MREMKNSGIEWIGEIPIDWDVVKVSYLFRIGRGRVIAQTELEDNGKYPVYSSQTKNDGCLGYINTYDFDLEQITWTTDGANAGTIFLRKGKHNCTNVCGTLQPLNPYIDLRYQKYALEYIAFYHKRADTNGFKIMNNEMAAIHTICPSLPEQHRIADFLDEKCAKIDAVIEKQKQVIEKLKEYKLSVITEAVTKGLDPTVPMKDSGVEWIGKIPEEWNLVKLKYAINKIGDIDHYMPESVDEGIPYLMTGDLKENVSSINFNACKKVSVEDYQALCKKMSTQKGDIIFARYATIGTVAYVDVECDFLVSYSCVTIRVNKRKLNGKYLFFYLKSKTFFEEVKKYINANTQGNVGIDSLNKVRMPLPPIDTQKTVVDYIERKSNEIDLAIAKKQVIVEKLTEYKKSLIYEVVTGKREV